MGKLESRLGLLIISARADGTLIMWWDEQRVGGPADPSILAFLFLHLLEAELI